MRCVYIDTMKKVFLRSLDRIAFDILWPYQGLCPDPNLNLRYLAVADVLRRIPEEAYVALTEKADEFSWFIPDSHCGAMVLPFPCAIPQEGTRVALAKVLYLGPALERRGIDIVVASVAHELAHIFLGHDLTPRHDQSKAQEKEAWETVIAWGFAEEERAHTKFYQRFHSRWRSSNLPAAAPKKTRFRQSR